MPIEPITRDELFTRLRRQFGRFQFFAEAEILFRGYRDWGRVTDISRGGLFVEFPDPPAVGTPCTVHIALNQPLVLQGVVRHVVEERGMGLSISAGEESIGRFCALLTALSSDADAVSEQSRSDASRSAARKQKKVVPRHMAGAKQPKLNLGSH